MARRGSIQEKMLLLLLSGLALGLSRSPKGYFKILRVTHKAWREINRRYLTSSIKALYKSKLIQQKDNKNGTITFVLSSEGEKRALTYDLDKMIVKKHIWDHKWRIVIFDIPEKKKGIRNAFRFQLNKLGFIKLQHSVFVLPFKCLDELEYVMEFYNIRKFVRFIEANHIDNELDLKHRFNIV